MTDPFPIMIDVDENHLGSVLRKLDAMQGIMTIHLRMNKNGTPALPHQSAPALAKALQRQIGASKKTVPAKFRPQQQGGSLQQVLGSGMGYAGAVNYKLLKEVVMRSGYAAHSVGATLTKMIAAGDVKRIGPGIYRLTAKGMQKYLGRPAKTRPGSHPNNGKGLRLALLSSMKERPYSHVELKELLASGGYASNNMYTLVPRMIEEELIRRTGDTYEITEKGLGAVARKEQEPFMGTMQMNHEQSHGEHD